MYDCVHISAQPCKVKLLHYFDKLIYEPMLLWMLFKYETTIVQILSRIGCIRNVLGEVPNCLGEQPLCETMASSLPSHNILLSTSVVLVWLQQV